jgi:hypothetical protein
MNNFEDNQSRKRKYSDNVSQARRPTPSVYAFPLINKDSNEKNNKEEIKKRVIVISYILLLSIIIILLVKINMDKKKQMHTEIQRI